MPDDGVRFGPTQLGLAATLLYTATTKTYVRDINIANETGADVLGVFLSIGPEGAGKRVLPGVPLRGNAVVSRSGVIVLEAGDVIEGKAGTAAAITVTGSVIEQT